MPFSVFIIFYRGFCAFSFLADPVPFPFLFCLVYSDLLALDYFCEGIGVGCFFSFGLSNVYLCGPGRNHMDC